MKFEEYLYHVFDVDRNCIGLLSIPNKAWELLTKSKAGEPVHIVIKEPWILDEFSLDLIDPTSRLLTFSIWVDEWAFDELGNRTSPVAVIGQPRYLIEYKIAIDAERIARETYDFDPVERNRVSWEKSRDKVNRMMTQIRVTPKSDKSKPLPPLPKKIRTPEEHADWLYPHLKRLIYDRHYCENMIAEAIRQALEDRHVEV